MSVNSFFSRNFRAWLGVSLFVAAPLWLHADPVFTAIDSDGNGKQTVSISGASSFDPDGAIIDYTWKINNVVVGSGYGPKVQNLSYDFALGTTTVLLTIRDDAQVSVSTTARVIVLPQSSNLPPVANATVPSNVAANLSGVAQVNVDASASNDPNGDPINRYKWTEGTNTYYDGPAAVQTLSVSGLGAHTLTLTVFSTDANNTTQSGSKNFSMTITPMSETLAGHSFSRTFSLKTFSFDPPYQSFAGITFDPLTQTFFVTDNKLDKLFELQADGTLIRTVDIGGLKNVAVATTTDAEGIAWMHGQTFALALHDGKEIAVVTLAAGATTLTRSQATFYDVSSGPGKPKGLAYAGWEDAFYWVAKDTPKAVVKAHINPTTNQWETIWTKNVDSLPAANLSDVACFPRLSKNLFLISESSQTIMEVDMTGATPLLKSSMSLAGWPIPQAGGMTFGSDGKMFVVGKHVTGQSQDDFNVFSPTPDLLNQPPVATISSVTASNEATPPSQPPPAQPFAPNLTQ